MGKILIHIKVSTPVGDFHMLGEEGVHGKEIVIVSGFGPVATLRKRLPAQYGGHRVREVAKGSHSYTTYVEAYFKGDKKALAKIPCAQTGTDFSARVWRALEEIPFGETISYKALAEKAGNAKAIRAAGTACGANRLILLVPCHRVVKSDGGIGEYLYGKKRKAALILHERQ